jgi:Methyl-accepting chemotaxis protein
MEAEATETKLADRAQSGEKRRDLSLRLSGEDSLSRSLNALSEDFDSFAIEALSNSSRVSGATARLAADVRALDDALARQRERLGEVSGIAERSSRGFASLAKAAASAKREAAAASARTQENEAFMSEIAGGLDGLGQLVLRSEEFMRKLGSELSTIDSLVASLADTSDRLGVLAINTAIEAARAGEKGKGFAIIAKEIQSLSKGAFDETKRVGERVASVRGEVGGMSAALEKSRTSVGRSLERSRSVSSRFGEIIEGARRLDSALKDHATVVEARGEEYGELSEAIGGIAKEGELIAERARSAESLSEELRATVASTLERIGAYRTSLHGRALAGLEDIVKAIPVTALFRDPDTVLLAQFANHPWFELLYLMDPSGTQISANVVNPKYRSAISSDARGKSWREKEYFSLPRETHRPYISDIYVSVASERLCLTVSIPIMAGAELKGVLAADLDVDDISSMDGR